MNTMDIMEDFGLLHGRSKMAYNDGAMKSSGLQSEKLSSYDNR